MKSLIKNKDGSSIVLLAMVFVVMMLSITAAINIARALVVKSECETFGHVWNKAILSEYDINLLNDYNLMAYWGNDAEVQKKIDAYLNYSAGSKLDANIKNASAELQGYQLSDIKNFRNAVKMSFVYSAADSLLNDKERKERGDEEESDYGSRVVANPVVLDTLPSSGNNSTVNDGGLTGDKLTNLLDQAKNYGSEMAFIHKYMGNHVTAASGKPGYFKNEWEYLIRGSKDDDTNYKFCRNSIAVTRNVINLACLLKDPEKRAIITSVASCLTPGVAELVTTAFLAETWAAAETVVDMDKLLDNEKVPFIKTSDTWQTDIDSLLDSSEFKGQLDQESRDKLNEERGNIENMDGAEGTGEKREKGQTYDEYLMAMMMLVNKDVRTLRVMDVVQINMKYWHYRDFNMEEYYTGVRYSINANGRSYDFEDSYK